VDLCGCQAMGMRMVPIRARTPFREIERVYPLRARGDWIHRISILIGGDRDSVPMDRADLAGNAVTKGDVDPVSFRHFDQRPRSLSIVSKHRGLVIIGETGEAGLRGKTGLEQPCLAGFVGETGKVAKGFAFQKLRHVS
jgi:hypothetical protein